MAYEIDMAPLSERIVSALTLQAAKSKQVVQDAIKEHKAKEQTELERLRAENASLRQLCDEYFVEYYIKQYAGANDECLYCGQYRNKPHDSDCPIPVYAKLNACDSE